MEKILFLFVFLSLILISPHFLIILCFFAIPIIAITLIIEKLVIPYYIGVLNDKTNF